MEQIKNTETPKTPIGCVIFIVIAIFVFLWIVSAPPKKMTTSEINKINQEKIDKTKNIENTIYNYCNTCDNQYQKSIGYYKQQDFYNASIAFSNTYEACNNTSIEIEKLRSDLYDTNYDKKLNNAIQLFAESYMAKANASHFFVEYINNKNPKEIIKAEQSISYHESNKLKAVVAFQGIKIDIKNKMVPH